MPAARGTTIKAILASVVVVCTLVVSMTVVCGLHEHSERSSHCCDFCHFGQLPWMQASAVTAQFSPPAAREWRHCSDEIGRPIESGSVAPSTRAPPTSA